jgi:hypothetical protein
MEEDEDMSFSTRIVRRTKFYIRVLWKRYQSLALRGKVCEVTRTTKLVLMACSDCPLCSDLLLRSARILRHCLARGCHDCADTVQLGTPDQPAFIWVGCLRGNYQWVYPCMLGFLRLINR